MLVNKLSSLPPSAPAFYLYPSVYPRAPYSVLYMVSLKEHHHCWSSPAGDADHRRVYSHRDSDTPASQLAGPSWASTLQRSGCIAIGRGRGGIRSASYVQCKDPSQVVEKLPPPSPPLGYKSNTEPTHAKRATPEAVGRNEMPKKQIFTSATKVTVSVSTNTYTTWGAGLLGGGGSFTLGSGYCGPRTRIEP